MGGPWGQVTLQLGKRGSIMHTCKNWSRLANFKSQSSHFQPQLGAKQPDHADYVNADGANGLENFTKAVR